MSNSLPDRFTGCLVAGALGDALGAAFEGSRFGTTLEDIPDFLSVTDDTQLTIATCEAIIEIGAVDPETIARHFLKWYRQRRITGIGSSTLKALRELEVGGHWALVGATGEYAAGNGAAMRIAPLAFFLDPDSDTQRRTIRDVCRITHHHDEAYLGALTILRAIRSLRKGKPLTEHLLPQLVQKLPDCRVRDRLILLTERSFTLLDYTTEFGATGYVVDSVPLSLLAAIRSTDFLETIGEIIQCGGDTDTIASLFGNLYGTAYGSQSLPAELLERVDAMPLVRETAQTLSSWLPTD